MLPEWPSALALAVLVELDAGCWLPSGSRLPQRGSTPRRALFLDRDGVLVEDVHFVRHVHQVHIIGETVDALRALQERYLLIVASNQSGVGRGYLDTAMLEEINRAVVARLAEAGVALDGVYYCPHLPAAGCACRKPAPGMLLRAAAEWGLDMTTSYMVGDRATDLEAGHAAGVQAFLLPTHARADAWTRLTALLS
jgi:histidinol-phosphate phosphatase family protein